MNKFFKITAWAFVLTLVFSFLSRNFILNRIIENISQKVEKKYDLVIHYQDVSFQGVCTVCFVGLKINTNGESVVNSDTIVITPRISTFLVGKLRLSELKIANTYAYINQSFIDKMKLRNTKTEVFEHVKSNYAEMANSLINRFYTYIPAQLIINKSKLTYTNDSVSVFIATDRFQYINKKFKGQIRWGDNTFQQSFTLNGTLNLSDYELKACIFKNDNLYVHVPYLQSSWSALVGFDTLRFSIISNRISKSKIKINGNATVSKLKICHKRIGKDTVSTESADIHFESTIGDRFIELDSASVIRMNQFSFSPYVKFENENHKIFTLKFIREVFKAQDLVESLPKGLFSNFEGMKTRGRLAFHLNTKIDFECPDSVVFDSQLEDISFDIEKYGVVDFRKLNNSFVYDVFEKDKYIKSFAVGEENPDFVELSKISPFLISSILTSEDGSFFYHRGFNEEAFRNSISTNIKEKRFARGGSTISMQLVKNVFLSRNKTISRKIEEALIVWIIENKHLVPKERMLEVYLNIIEFGPNVYGIKQAAWFYFKKQPAQLTLAESIFISSIIPRPKGFRYMFVENGVLKSFLAEYYTLLVIKMLQHKQITELDTIGLKPTVKLVGDAVSFFNSKDSVIFTTELEGKDN